MKPKICSYYFVWNRRGTAGATHRASVELTVSVNGTQARMSMGMLLLPGEWLGGRVVNRPDARQLNDRLDETYRRVAQLVHEPGATARGVLAALCDGGGSVTEWIRRDIDGRGDLAANTLRHLNTTLLNLEAWGRLGEFSTLTTARIEEWDRHLRKDPTRKGSTLHRYHRDLRACLGRAVRAGLLAENPYSRFRMPKLENAAALIKFLTEEERRRVEELPDLTGNAAVVRDMFVFCCYTGLSYADMQSMSPDDVNESADGDLLLTSARQKTGSPYRIVLLRRARAIGERYGWRFPRLSNQKCNDHLKVIQAAAGIRKRLTMHVARHTFATWALNRGVPLEVVSKMLAHSNVSTTQIYARVLQREVARGFRMLEDD